MTDTNEAKEPAAGQGKAFFDRADEVAETGNWDFAIEMYIEGIKREPDSLKRGHAPLRDVALKRKIQGGKGPGMGDRIKRRGSKDPIESLANAEYLLAKEPGSVAFMEQVLQATRAANLEATTKWICDILFQAQREAPKANLSVLAVLTTAYAEIEEYASAMQACEMALQLSPDNGQVQQILRDMSAKYTLQKGGYGQEGDFAKGIKDLDKQKELIEKDRLVQDISYLERQIDEARKECRQDPTVAGKINTLVDALLKIEDDEHEQEAIDVLTEAHKATGAYPFKMRIGDIEMKQRTRLLRKLYASGDRKDAAKQARENIRLDLAEYTERAGNYPTDLAIRYELGLRQYLAGQYDEAIASLQQAQRDPRRHLRALNYLGQAFGRKGLLREAADTFERALETDMTEEHAKGFRYNLGDVLEQMGQLERAREQFSQVAQIDYEYKDVRKRLEDIRGKIKREDGQSEGETT